jgi:cupin fold WbuC family metalloprotein
MLKVVSKEVLDELSQKAKNSPRARINHNYHNEFDDPINRMLNAFEPGTYVRPHKHERPDKREVFIVLRGRLGVVILNDSGVVTDFILLDREMGNYAIEIPPGVWHTVIALETATVVYEVKDGPYSPIDDKNFASWAPREGEAGCVEYLAWLTDQLRAFKFQK